MILTGEEAALALTVIQGIMGMFSGGPFALMCGILGLLLPVAVLIYLLTGTVIIETIFNRPGMGKFVAFAAQQLDYAGILGGTLFFSLVLVVGNLIVDVLYAVYDPRIQLG